MLRRSLILVAFAATTITVLDVGSAMAIPAFASSRVGSRRGRLWSVDVFPAPHPAHPSPV